ncbi:TetR/AcrR family transcriptional regulator C-terminal domain-containing protein [Acidiferrimicrobium sp. IK]|uniref:TetR/AcrR family transcriptional regulator C-terminal domain-containing protein n=1 Tax=Acidiferrimicrobium sp. IK TaxID=2871700 RepID=UPI0021CB0AFB|nr:TetR/AcrR family transcriptional regulator C-terminal domain-containing protein [Acidiferrimicrobium sp. IK]MCU4183211.1 TetR/AcrR family transcriptional regulator C-terminal domain-containing protein [Acidiferrimicrobium sp. IK]
MDTARRSAIHATAPPAATRRLATTSAEIANVDERAEVQRRKRIALASLPLRRYPHIAASADYLTDCDSADSYFEEGLALVLAGVQHQAAAPAG